MQSQLPSKYHFIPSDNSKEDFSVAKFFKIDVVLPRPIDGIFSYVMSVDEAKSLKIGCIVKVPLARAETYAYVVAINNLRMKEEQELKPVLEILDNQPSVNQELLTLTKKVAEYYQSQWGWVIKTALPPGINPLEKKQIVLKNPNLKIEELEKEALKENAKLILIELKKCGNVCSTQHLSHLIQPKNQIPELIRYLLKQNLIEIQYLIRQNKVKSRLKFFRLAIEKNDALQRIEDTRRKAPRKADVMFVILDITNQFPTFTARDINAISPGASRYLVSLNKEKYIKTISEMKVLSSLFDTYNKVQEPFKLMKEQRNALEHIYEKLNSSFSVTLLHGVTGSGKTEVYLRAAKEVLNDNRDVLILVPEIGLTPIMISIIQERFKGQTALLHSKLDNNERLRQWQFIRQHKPKVVLGTRSAVFAPLWKPGLIIVDEEHDTSFKQANNPSYNARDVAVLRGFLANCPVILGSATPSLESFTNTVTKKYSLISMPNRIENRPMPSISIIDMKHGKMKKRKSFLFSNELIQKLEKNLSQNEQSILFIPRRGFSNFVVCHSCGYIPHCEQCSVSLTYHYVGNVLKCHYCNHSIPMPVKCPQCGSEKITGLGMGTQRVAEEIKKLFPKARIARLDTDSTHGRNIYNVLRNLALGKIDILIGTQMITKGHDFKNVTLVGVLASDTTLYLPDFRAAERTFQLLTQVAGRTGRGEKGGEVIIQSFNPNHHCIKAASKHDYMTFYQKEILYRKSFRFPPYSRLANIIISGKKLDNVIKTTKNLVNVMQKKTPGIELLGPAPAPISRIKSKYRWHIIIKGKKADILADFIKDKLQEFEHNFSKAGIEIFIDIDPMFLL